MILGRIAERVSVSHSRDCWRSASSCRSACTTLTFDPGTTIRGVHAHGYVVSAHQIDVTNWTISYGWAAGSMVSTLGDLKAWGSDLVRGARLDRAIQRQRLRFIATPAGLHATIVILANASPLLDSPALSNPFPPPPAVPDTLNVAVRLLPLAFPLGSPGTSPAC